MVATFRFRLPWKTMGALSLLSALVSCYFEGEAPRPATAGQAGQERSTGERPAFLSLLKCVAAGDHLWLEVAPEGEARSFRAGRGLRVFESRQGRLGPAEAQRIQDLLTSAKPSSLQPHYPFQPMEGVEVEDVYYALTIGGTDARSVVAHEGSIPESLTPLLLALERAVAALPQTAPQPPEIIALPVEILSCLGEDAKKADADAPGSEGRKYVLSAIQNPGRAVEVLPKDLPLIEQTFRGSHLIRFQEAEQELALLLLRPE